MICPKCNQESINFDICPYCNYDFKTIPSELDNNVNIDKLRAKLNIFYISVIIIGLIILIFLIINLFNKNKVAKEDNGPKYENITTTTTSITVDYIKSSPINPIKLNELTIGSIKDNSNYYDAYVKGTRLIESNEALSILQSHGLTFNLQPGFRLEGLVYEVYIKDSVSINPVMNSVFFYADTGNDFVNIDGNVIKPKVTSIYEGGNITKDETKEVILVYETNTDNYSICLGFKNHKDACINPKKIE